MLILACYCTAVGWRSEEDMLHAVCPKSQAKQGDLCERRTCTFLCHLVYTCCTYLNVCLRHCRVEMPDVLTCASTILLHLYMQSRVVVISTVWATFQPVTLRHLVLCPLVCFACVCVRKYVQAISLLTIYEPIWSVLYAMPVNTNEGPLNVWTYVVD